MKLYLEHDESIDFYVSLKRVKRLMTVLHFKCQSRIKKHHRVKQEEQELIDLIEAGVYYFNYIDRTTQRNGSTANEYRREAA